MMAARELRRSIWFVAVPLIAAVLATGLFLVQGGFGGGHGRFDQAIGLLGLPSILCLENIPLPRVLEEYDLLLVVWVPAVANCILWVLAAFGIQALRRGHG
jgi:hypothetical protein